MATENETINACPFCGNTIFTDGGSQWNYKIICGGCYASGPQSTESPEDAVELWNRRAPEPQPEKFDIAKIAQEKLKQVYERREKLVEAWIAETGLKPSESVLCQSGDIINGFRYWVEKKTSNDEMPQPEKKTITVWQPIFAYDPKYSELPDYVCIAKEVHYSDLGRKVEGWIKHEFEPNN